MADNKIRLRQLDEGELSGYIGGVYAETVSGKSTDLNPSQSGAYDLGQENLPWKTVYAHSISVTGFEGAIDRLYPATGNLLPIESGAYDLGSMGMPWKDLYLDWNSLFIGGYKIGVQDGVLTITPPGGTATAMAEGPQGPRGGFGGDSALYHYDHQTGATQEYPNTGYFTFNSTGDFDDATELHIHTQGYYSETGKFDLVDNSDWITSLFGSSSDPRGVLRLFKHDNPSSFSIYNITGSASAQPEYFTVPLSFVNSSETNHLITGAFEEEDKIVLSFSPRGDIGEAGPQGPGVGDKGDVGPQGPQGDFGPQGPQGDPGGPVGPQGASITWSGIWNAGVPYDKLAAVRRDHSSFISLTGANLGRVPQGINDDYWDLMASGVIGPQGPQGSEGGPPGVTGPQGIVGPQGAQGSPGPIGTVTGHAESTQKIIQQDDFWIGANAFGVIDVLRFNGSEFVRARANSEPNSETIGIVKSLDTGNNSFTVVTEGFVSWPTGVIDSSPFALNTAGDAEFEPGSIYWLDDSIAGLITTDEPSIIGSVSKPIFYATSETGGFIQNYRGQIIESGLGPKWLMPGIGDVTRHGAQRITSKTLSLQTSFGASVLNWGGVVNIDFDGEPFQLLEMLGSTTIDTINAGLGKTVTLRLQNSTAFDWGLTFGSNPLDKPRFVGSLAPTQLKAGKVALVSFTSFGSDQNNVIVGYANEK